MSSMASACSVSRDFSNEDRKPQLLFQSEDDWPATAVPTLRNNAVTASIIIFPENLHMTNLSVKSFFTARQWRYFSSQPE